MLVNAKHVIVTVREADCVGTGVSLLSMTCDEQISPVIEGRVTAGTPDNIECEKLEKGT